MRVRLVAAALVVTACQPTTTIVDGAPVPGPTPTTVETVAVSRVDDGDTVHLEDGRTVRLVGINAPEADECFGDDAKAALAGLVEGREVGMGFDVEPRDQFDRLLALLVVDGSLVNLRMVADGYALAISVRPNVMYEELLAEGQRLAQQQESGMWSLLTCGSAAQSGADVANINPDPPGPDGDYLNDEWVVVRNGGDEALDLSGWMIRDESSRHRFVFSADVVVAPGSELRVVTGCGEDSETVVFWCSPEPVWNNAGDTAYLIDADGRFADYLSYSE